MIRVILWSLLLCILGPRALASQSESYAELVKAYTGVRVGLEKRVPQAAIESIERCGVPEPFSGRATLDLLRDLIVASQAIPNDASSELNRALARNNYSLSSVQRLGTVLAHDVLRYELLKGNAEKAANVEREAMLEAAKATFAVLDYLAGLPLGVDDAWSSGLLHSSGAILGVDRLLTRAGVGYAGSALAAQRVREGADAMTALRLGRGDTILRAAEAGEATDSDQVFEAALLVSWAARAPWVAPRVRGEAALLGLDLLEHTDLVGSNHGMSEAQLGAWFVSAAVGTSPFCDPELKALAIGSDGHLPGGSAEYAAEAARRAFEWQLDLDGDVHRIGGLASELSPRESQALLCNIALRSDIEASVPAALALAERVFFERHLPGSIVIGAGDKELAYQLALLAIYDAATLRERGVSFAGTWWSRSFGELLTPLLNPMYSPTRSNMPKYLAEWARFDATEWLAGLREAPTYMREVHGNVAKVQP